MGIFSNISYKIKQEKLSDKTKDEQYIFDVLMTIDDEKLRLNNIRYLKSDDYKIKLLKTIKNEEIRLLGLAELKFDDSKVEVLKTIVDENLRLKGINELAGDRFVKKALETISNPELKILGLDCFMFDNFKIEIIKSMSSDEFKLRGIKKLIFDGHKVSVIKSLSTDEAKIEGLKELTEEIEKVKVIKSFFSDELKWLFLQEIENEENKIEIIKTFCSKSEIINQLNLIVNFDLVIEAMNDINLGDYTLISEVLINKYSKYYQISNNRLKLLVEKFGYKILCSLGNINIRKIFDLNDEDFAKYMAIFDRENINLDMDAINDVANLLFQRLFKKEFSEICSIFQILRQLIDNHDKEKIRLILNEINQHVKIEEYLHDKSDMNNFIECLIDKKDINILHDITNKYIMVKRNDYVREKLKNIGEELDFDYKYEKSYIVKKVIKLFPYNFLIRLIKTIDTSILNEEELKLINNKELLTEIIKFKKSPKKYGDNSSIRNYFKSFDKLFSILYDNDKLIDIIDIDEPNVKKILVPQKVSSEYLISIMRQMDVDKLRDKLFTDDINYNNLLKVLNKYKLLGSGSTYDRLLDKASVILDNTTLASLIDNFYRFYPELKSNLKNNKIDEGEVKIPLSIIIDNANVYGSDSYKYFLLFGYDNYKLLSTDPPPKKSSATMEERLKLAIEYVIAMYKRKYVTVPPLDIDIEVKNKKINVVVGNITNMINLTYGERTESCMRIEGLGKSLFDFCLKNKNGFHIRFSDPNTGKFISRVSGIRNGNTVFLNQLRDSTLKQYDNDYLVKACYEISKLLVEISKNSEYPIDNVVISPDKAMGDCNFKIKDLGLLDIKKGFSKSFLFNVDYYAVVLATSANGEDLAKIELEPDKVTYYQLQRDKIKECNNEIEIIENIARIQIIDQLLDGIPFEDCDYNVEKNIYKCYVGEDFYLTIDDKENINYYIMKNSINKEIAMKEIKNIINEIEMSLTIMEEVEEEYVSKKRN